MSPQNSSKGSGVVVEKPGLNIYTVLLIIALACISIACLLLFLELGTYGDFPWWKAN